MQHFNYLAAIFVVLGILSAIIIAFDLRKHRQPMRIMNSVWVLTGLWANVFGLWAYSAFGRAGGCSAGKMAGMKSGGKEMDGMKMQDMDMKGMKSGAMKMDGMEMAEMEMGDMKPGKMNIGGMAMPGMKMDGMAIGPERPKWQSVVLSTLHCGAGCTLADIVGEWFMFFVPVAIGGSLIAGTWSIDFVLALLFGIAFQYAAIRGMERISAGKALRRAAKADVLSLTAWQVGMYGWMAVVIFGFGDGVQLPRDTFWFWFMMQIAMLCGFIMALPVNVLLIRMGIKKAM